LLVPDDDRTRLISRNRIRQPYASPVEQAAMRYLMEPGSLVMERKMLVGIKKRAESPQAGPVTRHHASPSVSKVSSAVGS
jgi:hypothetical protein